MQGWNQFADDGAHFDRSGVRNGTWIDLDFLFLIHFLSRLYAHDVLSYLSFESLSLAFFKKNLLILLFYFHHVFIIMQMGKKGHRLIGFRRRRRYIRSFYSLIS